MVKEVNANNIVVKEAAFAYLYLQKGKLQPLGTNRVRWIEEYRRALNRDYQSIKPWLPKWNGQVETVLDVGSGLGGIDIMLHRHYEGNLVPILMDGIRDEAHMNLHRQTYNDMTIAEKFHGANGVIPIFFVDANARPLLPLSNLTGLVISLGSWCFHYEPNLYLDYVMDNTREGATIITDVRKNKPEWTDQLQQRLNVVGVVHGAEKYDRMVFERP